jgi:hypothetical protein
MPTGIDGEWPVPDTRGRAGAPKGNRNAFKHGRYSAEAIASRREVAAPIQPCALWPAVPRRRAQARKADQCEAA